MSSLPRIRTNLEMWEGARFWAQFTWESGDDEASLEPVDLTGYTAKMEIRATLASPTPLGTLTTENGLLIFAPDQVTNKGDYDIDLPGADSEGWCPAHVDVKAVFDLFLYDGDGVARAHQGGDLVIHAAVTRPWEATPA